MTVSDSKLKYDEVKNGDEPNVKKNAKTFKEELNEFCEEMPITEDTTCGYWLFKGPWMQKFANKHVFVLIYGISGLMNAATYAYFSGTISTMEKRYKVQSKTMGIILVGNDITQLVCSVFLSYYAGKGHRPRWIALGSFSMAVFCFLCALPHLLYGPGEDALQLTLEYGDDYQFNATTNFTTNSNNLCNAEGNDACELSEGSIVPLVVWFIAQLISGIGGTLYYSLGYTYMDDNIEKTKSPLIISFTYFIRTLGPTVGYSLVSVFLRMYIAPSLTPTIDNTDPRWLGAWWLGWLIMGSILVVISTLLTFLPKDLPRAVARRELIRQKSKEPKEDIVKPSLKDMMATVKRLMTNEIYIYNQLSILLYVFGYNPYWLFLPKYIETQYRQSASASSLVTGVVGLIFSAIGILVSGIIVQKFKPRARYMAFWNVFIALMSVLGVIGYSMMGCSAVDEQITTYTNSMNISNSLSCNANCKCDFVKFSPVCSISTKETFISACHAGCTQQQNTDNNKMIYTNCSCIPYEYFDDNNYETTSPLSWTESSLAMGGSAISGTCQVDCQYYFYMFLVIVSILKLTGAMGRVTTFLLSVRCVEERDKAVSLGIQMSALSIFAFIPSPIFFGYVMDSACVIWGKTCTESSGNCWLYNAELMRTRLNYSAAFVLFLGLICDVLIWCRIKDISMFGEEPEVLNKIMAQSEEEEEKLNPNITVKEVYGSFNN